MRALGHYPSEREIDDMLTELRAGTGAAGSGTAPCTSVGFDRFIAMYVNHRPVFGIGRDHIEEAFEALGAEPGDTVPRASLLDALMGSGEAMSVEELTAAAEAGPRTTGGPLMVYQCTSTHSPHPPPRPDTRVLTVYPYTLAASSSLA